LMAFSMAWHFEKRASLDFSNKHSAVAERPRM
jgi:hypothetical protein